MASWAVLRAFARTKNHQPLARRSRIPPNNNRQGINHFAPRPPAPLPPPGATTPVPDTFADQQSMAKPTHRAQSASDGLGRIVRTAPQPPPGPRTHLGPTPTAPPNLPHLTESATPSQAPKPANRPNPVAEGSSLAENRVLGSQAHRPRPNPHRTNPIGRGLKPACADSHPRLRPCITRHEARDTNHAPPILPGSGIVTPRPLIV